MCNNNMCLYNTKMHTMYVCIYIYMFNIAYMFQSTGIEMSEQEIDKLIGMLDQDGDGEIDYG
jgi:Ca2+-binding EF-hand superfamily protein